MKSMDLTENIVTIESGFDIEPISIYEFRDLGEINTRKNYISYQDDKKIQSYELNIDQLSQFRVVFSCGLNCQLNIENYILAEAVNNRDEIFPIFINPALIWDTTRCYLNTEIVDWSLEQVEEIHDIVFSALMPIFDHFDWSLRRVGNAKGKTLDSKYQFALQNEETDQNYLVAYLEKDNFVTLEQQIRKFNVTYHKNCIWLGRKIKFQTKCYINLTKSNYTLNELSDIKIGDLFHLQQNWISQNQIRISSNVYCIGRKQKRWSRKIYLNMDEKDVNMEFNENDWTEEESSDMNHFLENNNQNADEFTVGDRGPDAVHLNVYVGATTLSFNELCNIQNGSLVEIKESALPIVKLNIGEETIFEGELVRLNDQLMVQVTKKVA